MRLYVWTPLVLLHGFLMINLLGHFTAGEGVTKEGYGRIPLLHTPSTMEKNGTGDSMGGIFPVETYVKYVQMHLTTSSKRKTQTLDTLLVKQLMECLGKDSNCAYVLGNLYFMGLVPPGVVHAQDSGKNVTRAFVLWHYAAALGNPDAQYQLGVVYSLYYNPPSFSHDPQHFYTTLKNGNVSDFFNDSKVFSSSQDKINALVQNVPTHEFEALFLTMRVLDAKLDGKTLPLYEKHLLKSRVNHFPQALWNKSRSWINGKAVCCKALVPFVQFTKEFCFLDDFCPQPPPTRSFPWLSDHDRFPLHRRDGLSTLYFYLAAQGGHIGAQLALGYRHFRGLAVPERCHTAASYYLRVAREVLDISSEGIPQAASNLRVSLLGLEAMFELEKAQTLSASGDLKAHYLELQFHVAQSGDARTQTAVGKLHFFGLEDIPQDFHKAFYYFNLAAQNDYKEAIAYLGYHYALGLGTPKDLHTAYKLFSYVASYSQNSLAHNGLGYIYFKGTSEIPVNYTKALYHFNISASNGFPDAHYNLGAMYISGVGVPQSFVKGFTWLTRAVEQGHSGATYMMGLIHLNGIGTLRDCRLASTLFRRVAMKHYWVVERIQKISTLLQRKRKDEAAFLYWSLAEAGHDASQSDLAILLDGGGFFILTGDHSETPRFLSRVHQVLSYLPILARRFFRPTCLFSLDRYPSLGVNRVFAQRYWELVANQRSPQGYCRLGDYAYYGWGVTPLYRDMISLDTFQLVTGVKISHELPEHPLFVDNVGVSMSAWGSPREPLTSSYVRRLFPDYKLAMSFYEATSAAATSANSWGAKYAALAQFSLARLHQRGLGVSQDLKLAAQNIQKMIQLDGPTSLTLGRISLIALRFHSLFLYVYTKSFYGIFMEDKRLLMIVLNCLFLLLIALGQMILRRRL